MPRAEIKDGPSKWDLSVAMFDLPGGMFRSVHLTIVYGEAPSRLTRRNVEAIIHGCTRAPGQKSGI